MLTWKPRGTLALTHAHTPLLVAAAASVPLVLRQRPRVSEKGTIQLSIDTDSVRRLLLEFPRAARPLDDASEFASYAHHVEREMGGAINLVKVLQVGTHRLGAALHLCCRVYCAVGHRLAAPGAAWGAARQLVALSGARWWHSSKKQAVRVLASHLALVEACACPLSLHPLTAGQAREPG